MGLRPCSMCSPFSKPHPTNSKHVSSILETLQGAVRTSGGKLERTLGGAGEQRGWWLIRDAATIKSSSFLEIRRRPWRCVASGSGETLAQLVRVELDENGVQDCCSQY